MKQVSCEFFFNQIYILLLLALFASNISATNQDHYAKCKSCHLAEYKSWMISDHANSMAVASPVTVLADFDQKQVNHYDQKAIFFRENEQFKVKFSYAGKVKQYQIQYTFGYYPLQQYLVEIEEGRYQVLPFSWDSRSAKEGGQRWFHNYSDEAITQKDRLHWKQPLQNWNGMCADCHSDGLKRHYDQQHNRFNSSWENINVGCNSCHGDMSDHGNISQSKSPNSDPPQFFNNQSADSWSREPDQKTAVWTGVTRDNQFMDACFSCHALRAPLTDGFNVNETFLDQFTPQLLATPNYYADGQIKEEVYVYGSFLQSKMWEAGVNCVDCHDSHSMKLKIQGNGLCTQCHDNDTYNVNNHHNHQDNSKAAQCVNCHMTSNRYMGVDDRRDHSFKIPRPDISVVANTPNACITCHNNKSNQWASKQLANWFGKQMPMTGNKQHLIALNLGQKIELSDHLKIIQDEELDIISRSTALQLLNATSSAITANMISSFSMSDEPLIRLAAAQVAGSLSMEGKIKILSPLLKDEFKSVRVTAARGLVKHQMPEMLLSEFKQAYSELEYANNINSWRGEGRLNQGLLAIEESHVEKAILAFEASIIIEPFFDMGYTSLAELHRLTQRPDREISVLKEGLANLPNSALLNYSYGLYWVRKKELSKAIIYFDKAMNLSPENAQFAYTLILAIDGQDKTSQALTKLKSLMNKYNNNNKLNELASYLSQKLTTRDN